MNDYLRPWKLITLAIGMGLLIAGALYFKQADWDVGISFIMGLLTYQARAYVSARAGWPKATAV